MSSKKVDIRRVNFSLSLYLHSALFDWVSDSYYLIDTQDKSFIEKKGFRNQYVKGKPLKKQR